MPDNQQNHSNGVSDPPNGTVDHIEEGIWKMKIVDNDGRKEGDSGQSNPYPDRPGEPDCIYFLRTGMCGYGINCRFNHPANAAKSAVNRGELPQREGQPDCGYYLKTGACKYGSTCKYHHPRDRHGAAQVVFNVLGLPMRPEENSCPYYMRTSTCKFGAACKFHHPQPASMDTALSVPGPGMISTVPSVHGQQSYMHVPLVYPSLPGPLAAQGWSTYMEKLDHLTPYVMGTSLVHNSKNQGGLAGGLHIDLPERRDQPECRYFMNTGSCRYGSDCKFNHPKEKMFQLSMNGLGPHGLPIRPGAAMCLNFSSYGICKFGPTCKFDHSISGYFPNYGFSVPSLTTIDQSRFSYPRDFYIPSSSDTSPLKSSKITDWISKPGHNVEINKNQSSDTKANGATREIGEDDQKG